jgi:hypothetical protein
MTDELDSLPSIPSGDPVLDQQVQRVCRAVDGRPVDLLGLIEQFGFSSHNAKTFGPAVAVKADWAREVLLQVSAERLDIRLPTTRWNGPAWPMRTTRRWKCIKLADVTDEALMTQVQRAHAARRTEYRICRFCGRSVPVEHRFDNDTCHGCASTHLGVVY